MLTSCYLKSLGLDLSNLMLLCLLSVFSSAALALNLSAGLIWGKQAICLEHLLTTTQKSRTKLSADFAFSSPHEFLVDFVDLFFCGSFLQIPFWFSKIYTLFFPRASYFSASKSALTAETRNRSLSFCCTKVKLLAMPAARMAWVIS